MPSRVGTSSPARLEQDVASVASLDVVPTILEVICRTTGLGFSAVARVTEDRWIACAVRDEIQFGLVPGGELRVETTICNEIRSSGNLVAIDSVAEDPAFRDHPTPLMYGFQSYISVPITLADGRFFGTLCGIDPRPMPLKTPQTLGMFKLFANLIGLHLDAQDRLTVSETALSDERQRSELQDQFIAVLGHDLRNPLAAIQTGAKVLLTLPLDEKATGVATVIDRSAARMSGLIGNVLDFARGRLGGGLTVSRTIEPDLTTTLEQVIVEMRLAHPARTIHDELRITSSIACDRIRIGQLLSNLLANALAHGDPAGPVWVRARTDADAFELSVANLGAQIPEDTSRRLFQPFPRAADRPDGRQGLGLGLYISAEIARAHGGSLNLTSSAGTPGETCFTLRIPRLGSTAG
jgi:signal transduction histidine kinase